MANWGKIIFGTAIGAGIIAGVYYALGLKSFSDKLVTETSLNIHSVSFKGLTLRIDVELKNPSENTLRLKQPFVKLSFNLKEIASSQIQDKFFEITKYNSIKLDPIFISIPSTNLLTLGDGLLNVLLNGKTAQIKVLTLSTIDLGFKKIPYAKTEVKTLTPKKNG